MTSNISLSFPYLHVFLVDIYSTWYQYTCNNFISIYRYIRLKLIICVHLFLLAHTSQCVDTRVYLTVLFHWSPQISIQFWSGLKYYIPFDLLNIDLLCCLCSGLEDQWVCGFEVLWGGCDPKHQHVGYGDQLQHEHRWPHVSKPACCISSGCVLLLLILLLIIALY